MQRIVFLKGLRGIPFECRHPGRWNPEHLGLGGNLTFVDSLPQVAKLPPVVKVRV